MEGEFGKQRTVRYRGIGTRADAMEAKVEGSSKLWIGPALGAFYRMLTWRGRGYPERGKQGWKLICPQRELSGWGAAYSMFS